MSGYKTKQREYLYQFFNNEHDKVFTISDILNFFKDNSNVGQSTIYRNLKELEKTGQIKRLAKIKGREAGYRYIDHDKCKNKIHLICSDCHESIHIDSEIDDKLSESIFGLYNFKVDRNSTIIYGLCKNCR